MIGRSLLPDPKHTYNQVVARQHSEHEGMVTMTDIADHSDPPVPTVGSYRLRPTWSRPQPDRAWTGTFTDSLDEQIREWTRRIREDGHATTQLPGLLPSPPSTASRRHHDARFAEVGQSPPDDAERRPQLNGHTILPPHQRAAQP